MFHQAPPVTGIPGTARNPPVPGRMGGQDGGSDFEEHSSGAGYACQTTASRCYIQMAAHPSMVRQARSLTRQALATWQLARMAEAAELIVSELSTNAIRASRASASIVAVTLALDLDRLYIMVWDDGPALGPRPVRADPDAEDGRGLSIVAMLSDQYGTAPAGQGKIIWSRISTTGT